MTAAEIAMLIEALATAVRVGYQTYNDTTSIINEEDANKIHAALLKAQAATAEIRPRVNAMLDELKKQPE